MKILAIESSSLVASVAIVDEENVIAEYSVNHKKTHSQTLMPMLDEIVRMTETELESIDHIAVSVGPGSFTGLRIGVATAKGLGLALDKKLVAVPTLGAMAYNLCDYSGLVVPVMDARRNQVYTGIYRFEDQKPICVMDQTPMDSFELIQRIKELSRSDAYAPIFLGDGVEVIKNALNEVDDFKVKFALPHLSRQKASAVGLLAIELAKKGELVDASELKPVYLRLSQAERERLEKGQSIEA